MHSTSIYVIRDIINDIHDIGILRKNSRVKEWQFNGIIHKLVRAGLVKKEGKVIKLQENHKAILFRKISQKWNLINLFRDSNENVLSYLTEPITVNEIATNTGLSVSTVYRAISDLKSTGAIQITPDAQDNHNKQTSELIRVNPSHTDLVIFAQILKLEREHRSVPDAEIIYMDNAKIIKKILKEKTTTGELTGFSMFTSNGIMYDSPYDYYVEQKEPLDLHDIIIHSVLASYKDNDKLGLIMSIVFYIHNKNKVDTKRLREIASTFKISSVWLDVEAYIRRQKLKNKSIFLPWDEFVSKAELYEIKPEQYHVPVPVSSLFDDVGGALTNSITIFLIGGENMRLKKIKAVTKDCDIVVKNPTDFQIIVKVLTEQLGYNKIVKTEYSQEDLRLYPDEILMHPDGRRIDLFTKRVIQNIFLSDTMIQTADYIKYGKLTVGVLRNEYIFLLKAVAVREGDIHDMAVLTQSSQNQSIEFEHGPFDWERVWCEIINQEKLNPMREMSVPIFEQISFLVEHADVDVPIFERLKIHVLTQLILLLIRGGRRPLAETISLLVGYDITERMIRNRIDALVKKGIIRKYTLGKDVFLTRITMPHFPYGDKPITLENVGAYLEWRFPSREQSTPHTIKSLVDHISGLSYTTIGDMDDKVICFIDKFLDNEYHSQKHHNAVDATKFCLEISDSKQGKN